MARKKLYRNTKEKMIGGVCAGLGDFLDVDPTIIRLGWAILTILSIGVGLIAYLVAWAIIPEEKSSKSKKK